MTVTVNIKDDFQKEFFEVLENMKSRVVESFRVENIKYETSKEEIVESLKSAIKEVNSKSIETKEKTLKDLINEL
jgi:hypothetical protein